jgi:hypothetical protein
MRCDVTSIWTENEKNEDVDEELEIDQKSLHGLDLYADRQTLPPRWAETSVYLQ